MITVEVHNVITIAPACPFCMDGVCANPIRSAMFRPLECKYKHVPDDMVDEPESCPLVGDPVVANIEQWKIR